MTALHKLFTGWLVMAFSQNLLAMQTLYLAVTLSYVLGLRLEFAQFYRETGHFKLNFSVENSNFSQFFASGINIHTFSHNFEKKKFRLIGTLRLCYENLLWGRFVFMFIILRCWLYFSKMLCKIFSSICSWLFRPIQCDPSCVLPVMLSTIFI